MNNNKKSLNAMFVNKTNRTLFVFAMLSAAILFGVNGISSSFAETSTIHLGDDLLLQKTVTTLSVPKDNVLPWATVSGTVDDPAQGYPVIIQFFNEESGDDPVHVAQVNIKENDTYEYKFRVRNVDLDTGEATNIFEGDYVVQIFKVVNASYEDLDSA